MIGLRDTQMIQAKVIELQSLILDAQSNAFAAQEERAALIDEARALKEEVARLKHWDAGKDNYRLTKLAIGAFAYTPRPNIEGGDPPHWLCVKCYDNRQRSVLQYQGHVSSQRESVYGCSTCKSTIQVSWSCNPDKLAVNENG